MSRTSSRKKLKYNDEHIDQIKEHMRNEFKDLKDKSTRLESQILEKNLKIKNLEKELEELKITTEKIIDSKIKVYGNLLKKEHTKELEDLKYTIEKTNQNTIDLLTEENNDLKDKIKELEQKRECENISEQIKIGRCDSVIVPVERIKQINEAIKVIINKYFDFDVKYKNRINCLQLRKFIQNELEEAGISKINKSELHLIPEVLNSLHIVQRRIKKTNVYYGLKIKDSYMEQLSQLIN